MLVDGASVFINKVLPTYLPLRKAHEVDETLEKENRLVEPVDRNTDLNIHLFSNYFVYIIGVHSLRHLYKKNNPETNCYYRYTVCLI